MNDDNTPGKGLAGPGISTVQLAENLPTLVIRPSRGWSALNLRDLWRYRELLFFLAWRDISVRYKQTALGAAWAIIQPFFTMVVFSIFFGRLAKMPSDGLFQQERESEQDGQRFSVD